MNTMVATQGRTIACRYVRDVTLDEFGTSASPDFGVYACGSWADEPEPFHVHMGKLDKVTALDAHALSAALESAARQADALNAMDAGRVLSVDERWLRGNDGREVFPLMVMAEPRRGLDGARFSSPVVVGATWHPEQRHVGEVWSRTIDDEVWSYEFLGWFKRIGADPHVMGWTMLAECARTAAGVSDA